MNGVFADTSFFIALLSPQDALHDSARQHAAQLSQRMVTSWYVLVETANFLRRPTNRLLFGQLLDRLYRSPEAEIAPHSQDVLNRGIDLYRDRNDKSWSLTDCTSFVVMQDYGITDAFTSDHHFRQAGLTPLL